MAIYKSLLNWNIKRKCPMYQLAYSKKLSTKKAPLNDQQSDFQLDALLQYRKTSCKKDQWSLLIILVSNHMHCYKNRNGWLESIMHNVWNDNVNERTNVQDINKLYIFISTSTGTS